MILMTDLRLLGVGLKDQTVAEVVDGLRLFKRIGFVVMVTCGLLLAGSEALQYYQNPYFWTKMALLVLVGVRAMVFKPTVYDQSPDCTPYHRRPALFLKTLPLQRSIAF